MEDARVIYDARLLASSLGQLPEPELQPAFVIVSGLPGTGKSYFCRCLVERLPFLVLESDALRRSLFPSPSYSAEESSRLFRAINFLIEKLLSKGTPLVLDATNLSEKHRERLYNIAERLNVKQILVRMEAPPGLVQERLKVRAEGQDPGNKSEAGWAQYQRMKSAVQKIRRHHYAVDTSGDITTVLDKIVREVRR